MSSRWWALLLVGVGACSYDPRRLALEPNGDSPGGDADGFVFATCGPGALECGEGEVCVELAGGARCECGPEVAFDGPVCAEGLEVCTSSGCNVAPVAVVLDDTPADPVFVAAGQVVRVDGTGSYDPDGGPLTFAWNVVSGDCIGAEVDDDAGLMRFTSAAGAGARCVVELVVTDAAGTSDTLLFEVQTVGVGPWVYNSPPGCADRSVSPTSGAPGSLNQPWCSVGDGLWAARAYGLAEVRVMHGVYSEVEQLVIPPGVTVSGGWDPSSGAPTTVRTPVTVPLDLGVRFAPGPRSALQHVALTSSGECGECAFVRADDNGALLGNIGISVRRTSGTSAVAVLGYSGGESVRLEAADLDISIAGGSRVYGLVLDGRAAPPGMEASLSLGANSTIEVDAADTAVGLLSLGASAVVVDQSVVSVSEPARPGPFNGVAAVDGLAGDYVPNYTGEGCEGGNPMDCCGTSAVCHGSASFRAATSTFWVLSAARARGVALFGTNSGALLGDSAANPNITNPRVIGTTGHLHAVALQLYGSSDVEVHGAALSAEVSNETSSARVLGIADGEASDGTPTGGSTRPFFNDVTVDLFHMGSGTPQELIGMALYDSQGARGMALDVTINQGPRAPTSDTPVLGIHTLETGDLLLERVSVRMTGGAAGVAAALMDGQRRDGSSTNGSRNLVVTNSILDTALVPVPASGFHGCLLLLDTEGAVINRNTVRCTLAASDDPNPGLVQVLTQETVGVRISRNHISSAFQSGAIPTSPVRIGVYDGSLEPGDTDDVSRGDSSRELEITANVIEAINTSTLPSLFLGVYLRAGDAEQSARVVNNFIVDKNAFASFGVVADHARSTTMFNTVRLSCPSATRDCSTSYGAGFYVVHGATEGPAKTVGNVFYLELGQASGVLDMTTLATSPWGFSELRFNYVTSGLPIYSTVVSNEAEIFASPLNGKVVKTCAELGAACTDNHSVVIAEHFCVESVHLAGTAPMVDAVPLDLAVADDLDRDPRPFGDARDAGADEVHLSTTGCARTVVSDLGG